VLRVPKGSAADGAGLRGLSRNERGLLVLGDIIVQADGRPVHESADLFRVLDRHQVGDKITLQVRRYDGTDTNIDVTLQALD